jgi:DNA mismatch endonuclease, patch repair protein
MDVFDRKQRSAVMRAVKSKNTTPEIKVRKLLHAAGYRFRLHRDDLPGKPDITFPGKRAVIFIHGCFWHQHPGCPHAARPSSNNEYWTRKLDRNVERDKRNIAALEESGWKVLVLWECQIKSAEHLTKIERFLGRAPNRHRS